MRIGRASGNDRVVASHSIARRAFALSMVFALVAAAWAVVILTTGGSWWGPLHSFLAGTILLAISGASQMFTVTWATTTPPSARITGTQRWLMALGVAAVLVGVAGTIEALVWLGAVSVAAGLIILAVTIYSAVRRSLLRRFDLSARFYVTAFVSGVVGVTLGAFLGADQAGASFTTIRLVHSHLNVVGLVGLTIIGTIPTFLPTVAHHRAVSGNEAKLAWWSALAGVIAIAVGIVVGPIWVGVGTAMIGASGLAMLTGIVARLWRKGHDKLPFMQVSLGMAWLGSWALIEGVSVATGGMMVPFSGWTAAIVLAGVGQILAGSLAYLVPVLKGPPLGVNLTAMTERGWIPLVAANVAGLALASRIEAIAVIATGVWVLDFFWRLLPVLTAPPGRARHG